MTDQIDDREPASMPADETASDSGRTREDAEKRNRREVTRLRDQLRSAQAEHDAALTTLRAQSRERLMRAELRSEAIRAGIVDLDGLRLADTSNVTFGDDGAIEGATDVISSLKASKPYLFSNGRDNVNFGVTTSPIARAPQPASPELVDARHLTREQWQAERARLLSRRS